MSLPNFALRTPRHVYVLKYIGSRVCDVGYTCLKIYKQKSQDPYVLILCVAPIWSFYRSCDPNQIWQDWWSPELNHRRKFDINLYKIVNLAMVEVSGVTIRPTMADAIETDEPNLH